MRSNTFVVYAVSVAAVVFLVASARLTPRDRKATDASNEQQTSATTQQPSAPAIPPADLTRPADETRVSTDPKQSKANQFLDQLIDPTVWLYVVIAGLAFLQVQVYWQMRDHATVIERGYISISHETPPGLFLGAPPMGRARLSIHIRNSGNTPAAFTKAVMRAVVYRQDETLPTTPDYGDHTSAGSGYLVKADFVTIRADLRIEGAENWQIAPYPGGRHTLYIIGYVDYIDAFQVRHRYGFGRRYDPGIDHRPNWLTDEAYKSRDNLWVITEANYVYDRPRKPDEGDDWD
jgi:hypothetical protein